MEYSRNTVECAGSVEDYNRITGKTREKTSLIMRARRCLVRRPYQAVDFLVAKKKRMVQEKTQARRKHIAYIVERFILFFIMYFVLFSLFAILVGKTWFAVEVVGTTLSLYGIIISANLCILFLITYTQYEDPSKRARKLPKEQRSTPMVSMMLAVHNEEDIIRRCLDSLIDQTYANYEIIVTNDASTDGTKAILDEYAAKTDITVIHMEKNVMKKRALGKAMLCAKGDIFAFTDSDCVLEPDAIERAVEAFDIDPMIGGVSGHSRALNAQTNFFTKVQDTWYETQYSVRKAFESVFGAVTCVSGPLAVFRKEAIYNYIPAWEQDTFLGQEFKFATDRTLTGFVLGSTSIGEKLKKKYADSPFVKNVDYPTKDWKIVYCKSARAYTQVPDTFARMIKQQVRWKKSFIRNMFFTGAFYWKKPFIAALAYYLHIIFVLVGPIMAFRHLIYIPLRGDYFAIVWYILGIFYVGSIFALAYKLEDKGSTKWIYRPWMSVLSTLVLSWIIIYSVFTIKKMVWHRG